MLIDTNWPVYKIVYCCFEKSARVWLQAHSDADRHHGVTICTERDT